MEILKIIFGMSITGSLMFFLFSIIKTLTKKSFTSNWHYSMIIIILLFFVLPVGNFIQSPINIPISIPFIETDKVENVDQIGEKENIIKEVKTESSLVSESNNKTEINNSSIEKTSGIESANNFKKNYNKNIFLYIWVIGMVGVFLLKIIPYLRFKGEVDKNSSQVIDNEIIELFQTCKEKLGIKGNVKLRSCEKISSPMLIGIFNPKVVIPTIETDTKTINMIFLHELNHYKRKDILIKAFALVVSTIHWFNPMIYLLNSKMHSYCEYSIDEKVIVNMDLENRKHYGQTILNLIDNSLEQGRTLTTNMSSNGLELKSRLENILFTKKQTRNKKIKSIFVLVLIVVSGFLISCGVLANKDQNSPLITYIKDDGLYYSYLNDGEETRIHIGTEFINPLISEMGSYIAYTHDDNLFIYDISKNKSEKIDSIIISYDWVDDSTIIYSTNNGGLTNLNLITNESRVLRDDYIYDNLQYGKEKHIYGQRIQEWSNEQGEYATNLGIVEISIYNLEMGLIVEGIKSTDDVIGYDPTIFDISEDGRYIYIMEKFSSGSMSADFGSLGVYDTVEKTHTAFEDIYENKDWSGDDLVVLPRKNNLAINPKDGSMVSVINGGGREMILDKELVLLDIQEDLTYKSTNFMDKEMVAMTPSFTNDGKKLLYSATDSIDTSGKMDSINEFEDWYNQPHNIYEYDIDSSKVKKVTQGNGFDFMPTSIAPNTILFARYKDNAKFSIIKMTGEKEEVVADNILIKDQFYGNIRTENSFDILLDAKRLDEVYKESLKENADKLYEFKNSKIGDNSAVSDILGYIEFPDEVRLNGIALDTKEEPYELRVHFKGTEDIQMKDIAMSSIEAWKSQSIILFSLIDNLSNIEYVIDD